MNSFFQVIRLVSEPYFFTAENQLFTLNSKNTVTKLSFLDPNFWVFCSVPTGTRFKITKK